MRLGEGSAGAGSPCSRCQVDQVASYQQVLGAYVLHHNNTCTPSASSTLWIRHRLVWIRHRLVWIGHTLGRLRVDQLESANIRQVRSRSVGLRHVSTIHPGRTGVTQAQGRGGRAVTRRHVCETDYLPVNNLSRLF